MFLPSNQIIASGLYESAEPNPNLTWETVLKANVGFDLSMWNGLLGVEFDVYRDYRKDKIIVPTDEYPTEYGISPSQYNAGKEERYGVDLTLTNHTNIAKDFSIDNLFVFGFSAFIIARMAYDLLLLNGFDGAWQYLYGPVSQETRDDLRRMILFENSDYPVSKGFANGALILMMLAVAASFVWFTFLA